MNYGIWKVQTIDLTTDARKYGRWVQYPYRVTGMIVDADRAPQEFSWQVPSLCDRGYDLSNAVWSDDAMAFVHSAAA